MLLYIVRHAWAEERDDTRWPDDSQRPLTSEGGKRFTQVVKKLVEADFAPGIIASSPFVRCRQTAELIAQRASGKPQIVPLDALAPGSNLAALQQWMAEQSEDEVAWVGHAPDVGCLAARLLSDGDTAIRFAKGAVAAIRFEGPVEPRAGELQWLVTAKLWGV